MDHILQIAVGTVTMRPYVFAFLAAYLVAAADGAAAAEAAEFAAAAAACAVEAPGVGGIRGRAVIEGRRRG